MAALDPEGYNVAMRLRDLCLLAVVPFTASCNLDLVPMTVGWYELGVTLSGNAVHERGFFETTDTVQYVAHLVITRDDDKMADPPPSNVDPSSYSWTSSDTRVADFVTPGRLAMRDTGHAVIEVTASTKTARFIVEVLPRITSLRLTPDSIEIAIGETATLTIEPLDAQGQVITQYARIATTRPELTGVTLLRLTLQSPGMLHMSGQTSAGWSVTGIKPGPAIVSAGVDVHRGARLYDASKVVVR